MGPRKHACPFCPVRIQQEVCAGEEGPHATMLAP